MTSVYPDDIPVHFLVTSDIHQIRDLLGPGLVESSSLEIPEDSQGYFLLYQEKDNRDRIDIETCEMRWRGISLKHKIYIPGHLDGGSSSFDDLFMSPRQPRREDYQSRSGISMHLLIYDNDTMLYFLHGLPTAIPFTAVIQAWFTNLPIASLSRLCMLNFGIYQHVFVLYA